MVEIIINKIKNSMIKKIIGGVLVFSSLMIGSVVFAQTTSTKQVANQATLIACVAPAVATREAAIQSAFSTFSTSMNSAFTKRAADLAAAWALTDKVTRNTAIKTADSLFRQSVITAKQTYNTARLTARQQFTTSRKACGAPAVVENTSADAI